jgi:enoyl-CoA hydratase/carnithine racemase
MSERDIIVERSGAAIKVILNRPQKRNAVTFAMWQRLAALFEEFGRDPGIRAVILAGAGGHFTAGADISEFAERRVNAEDGVKYEEAAVAALVAIRDCPKPTIAEITGFCVGGGLGLALACDFRIAEKESRFGIPAARLGIVYGLVETQLLVAASGPVNAKRILMIGAIFSAADAAGLGLIDQIAEGAVADAVRDFVATLTPNAPISIAGAKLIINAIAAGEAAQRAHDIERIMVQSMASEDYREGRQAFAEKRPPVFRGR